MYTDWSMLYFQVAQPASRALQHTRHTFYRRTESSKWAKNVRNGSCSDKILFICFTGVRPSFLLDKSAQSVKKVPFVIYLESLFPALAKLVMMEMGKFHLRMSSWFSGSFFLFKYVHKKAKAHIICSVVKINIVKMRVN